MFGALTFLPLFLQEVKGVSAIQSGVRLFPMMGGLFVASVGSGHAGQPLRAATRSSRWWAPASPPSACS